MSDRSRRRFLGEAMRGAAGLALSGPLARVLAFASAEEARLDGAPARWGTRLEKGMVQCRLCPLQCVLEEGQICFCRNRGNRGGELVTLARDRIAVLETAPVEKGPLFHFLPGARALTLGAAGCNLRCLYCQNWEASQRSPGPEDEVLEAPAASRMAGAEGCRVVGFNYTEPATTFELTHAIATRAKQEGLRTYMASGMSIELEPLAALLEPVDAVVGALKGLDPEYYRNVVGGELAPVLAALVATKKAGRWLEVSHLLVPTLNDSAEAIRKVVRWVKAELGPETPLHFARFVPEHKLANLPPTPRSTLDLAYEIGREEGLLYPYVSNLSPHPGNQTRCPGCGTEVIRRIGFVLTESRLGPGGRCLACDRVLHGVFA